MIPSTTIAVSTSTPESAELVVTVIMFDDVFPSPALILLIPTNPDLGFVIRNSSIFGLIFNPVDGSLIDDVTVPSGATSNPVIADNVLYFVSRDGDLHANR